MYSNLCLDAVVRVHYKRNFLNLGIAIGESIFGLGVMVRGVVVMLRNKWYRII